MENPDELARLRGYLEEHRATYERAALREKLIADGHDAETVDLAIAQVYGFEVAPATPKPAGNPRTRLILIIAGIFLVNYLLLPALVILLVGFADQTGAFSSLLGGFWPVPLAFLLEGVAAFALRKRDRTLARGIGWGIVVSLIPLVAFALLFGVCIVLLARVSG